MKAAKFADSKGYMPFERWLYGESRRVLECTSFVFEVKDQMNYHLIWDKIEKERHESS